MNSGHILSNDKESDYPYGEGSYVGFRVASVPEPIEPTIDSIISFIFDAIDAGTLQGEGAGNSADNKLNAFISCLYCKN